MNMTTKKIQIHKKFQPLFMPAPYKVAKSGRAGLKSWSFARALLIKGAQEKKKILCGREFQNSIKDSVHALLKAQVDLLGLTGHYEVLAQEIRGINGTEIIFRGLRNNPQEIKSTEGIDIAWIEEAQNTSHESWEIIIPTVRKESSEIWLSFNPKQESDSTWQRFIVNSPPGTILIDSNWRDNHWLSTKSIADKDHLKATDPDSYEYVWEGGFEVVRQGAYYHKLIMEAEKEGRICNVPYDPSVLVDVSVDLGMHDETDMWFWQYIPGGEYHLIDHLHGSDEDIYYYLDALEGKHEDTKHRKKYRYGKIYLPHDAKGRTLAASKSKNSVYKIVKAAGYDIIIVPAMDPYDRVQPTRSLLPLCWFDRAKTEGGLWSLRNYKRKYDEARQTYLKTPEHDKASHGADSFGHYAVKHKHKPKVNSGVSTSPPPPEGDNVWMGA